MRIRLLTDRAGYGFYQRHGEEIEVSAEEGRRLLAAGQAELVERTIETAAIDHRTKERRGSGRK